MLKTLFIVSLFSFIDTNSGLININPQNTMHKEISYLALGDSYTIGESVSPSERFPNQLISKLQGIDKAKSNVKIIAKTGWTTRNLLDTMSETNLHGTKYDFITLLIGVNNQYQGKPFSQYELELNELIVKAIDLLDGEKDKLILVSIPDYSATPFAASKDIIKISKEIRRYNQYMEKMAIKHGCPFIYITDLTQDAINNRELVADDKLHPSGKSYTQWVDRIAPLANQLIN